MKITVLGLGAIGSNILIQLAKRYPDAEFVGVDYDVIEERNMLTQAYFLEHIGYPKAVAMNALMTRYFRKPKFSSMNQKIEKVEDLAPIKDSDLILDCFDNKEARKLVKGLSDNVLHIGFSPQYTAEILWDKEYEVPGDVDQNNDDICENQDANSFINYIVSLACLTAIDGLEGKRNNMVVTQKTKIKKL